MKLTSNKGKKLTLEEIGEVYRAAKTFSDNMTIKSWKLPFLWVLWLFIGKTIVSGGFEFYLVDWRGIRYILKTIDPIEEK